MVVKFAYVLYQFISVSLQKQLLLKCYSYENKNSLWIQIMNDFADWMSSQMWGFAVLLH